MLYKAIQVHAVIVAALNNHNHSCKSSGETAVREKQQHSIKQPGRHCNQ